MLYHIVFLVVMTQAMNIAPRPTGHEPDTILGKMKLELTSPKGSCSFPPQEVLENYSAESFKFLENCNKFILTSSKDKDTLLCMGLFDVGLRICNVSDSQTFKSLTHHIPHTAEDFQKFLITEVSKQHSEDLCTALKDAVVKPQFQLTQQWNLKEVMEKSNDTCSRLCYDYIGNANVFCQLILWGNQMIARTTSENRAVSSPDNNQATGSDSMITGSQQDLSSPTGLDQSLSKTVVDTYQREGIPKVNSRPNGRKLAFNHMTNSTRKNVGLSAEQHAAELSQSTGTAYDTFNLKDATSSPVNSGLVLNGGTSADLPVEINESGFKGMPVQKQSSTNMKSTAPGNARQNKPTKAASSGLASSVGKTDSDQAIGQSQEDRPNTEKDKVELNMQLATKPSSTDSVSKTSNKVATLSSASAVDAVPQAVPIPIEADNDPHEQGVNDPFENEDQSVTSVDEDLNMPPSDLDFEPSKSETLGNENDANNRQEDMNNGNLYVRDRFEDSEDSHFFSYFFFLTGVFIVGYLVFHNKQKILALALEGRGRRGNRRRPNTANYHKLDSNLEEAVSSPCSSSSTHVIY